MRQLLALLLTSIGVEVATTSTTTTTTTTVPAVGPHLGLAVRIKSTGVVGTVTRHYLDQHLSSSYSLDGGRRWYNYTNVEILQDQFNPTYTLHLNTGATSGNLVETKYKLRPEACARHCDQLQSCHMFTFNEKLPFRCDFKSTLGRQSDVPGMLAFVKQTTTTTTTTTITTTTITTTTLTTTTITTAAPTTTTTTTVTTTTVTTTTITTTTVTTTTFTITTTTVTTTTTTTPVAPTTTFWPQVACRHQNTANDQALNPIMLRADLTSYGVTSGCVDGSLCRNTNQFHGTEYLCATVCEALSECKYWQWHPGTQHCTIMESAVYTVGASPGYLLAGKTCDVATTTAAPMTVPVTTVAPITQAPATVPPLRLPAVALVATTTGALPAIQTTTTTTIPTTTTTTTTTQAPFPAVNVDYFGYHDGHCAHGWIKGSNRQSVTTRKDCAQHCFDTKGCAYFSYSLFEQTCALYTDEGCRYDSKYPQYMSYAILRATVA